MLWLKGKQSVQTGQTQEDLRTADGFSQLVRNSGRFPLCGRGRINTYAIFAETNRLIVGATGRAGFIVPSGIATDDTTKYFFSDLVEKHSLVSLFEFENEGFFAIGRGHMNRFCLLTVTGSLRAAQSADFVFRARRISELNEPKRRFTMTLDDFILLNPNTRTCPLFRNNRDAEITKLTRRCSRRI